MALMGTVEVTDECGYVGTQHANPTITLHPGELKSISFSGIDGDPEDGWRTVPFDPALPSSCRATELSPDVSVIYGATDADGSYHASFTTRFVPRPAHSPILSPPSGLYDLDPAWKRDCAHWWTGLSDFLLTCKLPLIWSKGQLSVKKY